MAGIVLPAGKVKGDDPAPAASSSFQPLRSTAKSCPLYSSMYSSSLSPVWPLPFQSVTGSGMNSLRLTASTAGAGVAVAVGVPMAVGVAVAVLLAVGVRVTVTVLVGGGWLDAPGEGRYVVTQTPAPSMVRLWARSGCVAV